MVEPLECFKGPHGCDGGPVEYRFTGSGLRARPLCAKHQDEMLEVAERAAELTSPFRASWFDPSYAGEVWDEEDY